MKLAKKVLILPIISMLFSLSGCISFADDGWKKYNTPELFLSHSQVHDYVTVETTDVDGKVLDYDFKIRDLILGVDNYETISKKSTKSNRFISYKILISHSTAGPNYSNMYIYDDGCLQIDYKSALGRKRSFYYSFDSSKAFSLVDSIENRINEIIEAENEDLEKAIVSGSMNNFITAIEEAEVVPVRCWEDKNTYNFYDDNELLDIIKTIDLERSNDTTNYGQILLYNTDFTGEASLKEWHLDLLKNFEFIEIYYAYKNRFDYPKTSLTRYSLDAQKGRELHQKALEMAKR